MRRVFLAAFGVPAAATAIAIVAVVAGSGAQACTSPLPSPPSSVPAQLIPIFQGAAATYDLGPDGAAVLAAINYAESNFDFDEHGVRSGANSAGAAGPMQIGIGGPATDNWDTVAWEIPPSLPGGAEPPSVYNEVDAVYAAAALLERWGAPRQLARRAGCLERLPAGDRGGHPAGGGVHPRRRGSGWSG